MWDVNRRTYENGDGRNEFLLSSHRIQNGTIINIMNISEKNGIADINTIINKTGWHNPYQSTKSFHMPEN
jgi:hypothetical protein